MKHALSDEDVSIPEKPVKRVIAEEQLFCFGMVSYDTLLSNLPLPVDEVASRPFNVLVVPVRGALCIFLVGRVSLSSLISLPDCWSLFHNVRDL